MFFINNNHVRLSYRYEIVYLYYKIPKGFTRVNLNDRFWLMLIPFQFNMDSIHSTNLPINTSSHPVTSSFILFLRKFGTFTYNGANCFISPTTHFAICLLYYLSVSPLVVLVWMTSSWTAHIKLFVSRLKVPLRNHYHLSWFPFP